MLIFLEEKADSGKLHYPATVWVLTRSATVYVYAQKQEKI